MKRVPEIWLSDLFEVKRRLGISDPKTLKHVVKVLDIRLSGKLAEDEPDPEAQPEDAPRIPAQWDIPIEELELPSAPQRPLSVEPPELKPIQTIPRVGEAEWRDVDPLSPVQRRHLEARRPHLTLFDPVEVNPILDGMLATPGPGNEVDIPRVVSALAKGRPLLELPYRVRPSLFRGVRVLADLGPGMQMFRRDQDEMIARLRRLVGRTLVQVQWYEDAPFQRCGEGTMGSWTPFDPPHPGTPVLVLGDLGIGGHSGSFEQEWLDLAELLAHRESRLTALIPYRESRWPASLAAAIDLVEWDRPTSISDVTFRVRR